MFSFGPLVFWIITGLVGFGAFFWWIRQESRIARLLNEGRISGEDTTAVNVVQGIIVALWCGFIGWCFWRILSYINPRTWTELTRQEMAVRVSALVSLNLVVFAVFRFVFLFVAFGQAAIQRSPMQEQFIWAALGKILERWGLIRVTRPPGKRPLINKGRPVRNGGDNGKGGNGRVVEIEAEYEEDELTSTQMDGLELIQFLVLGQFLKNDNDEPILYSRRQWNGVELPSGRVMGVSRARAWAGLLSEMGILEKRVTSTGEALNISRAYTLSSAVEQIAASYDIIPPHPREWETWVRGVGVLAQPDPTHPTQG